MGYKSQRMEGTAGLTMESTTRSRRVRTDPGTLRLTQAGLLIAALGALLVIFGLIPTAGLVMTVVGAVLAARGGFGHRWYTTVAAGAALEVIARILAEGSETLGGWLAVIASLMIFVGVSLGYPTRTPEA
jgi:hypothetical protein